MKKLFGTDGIRGIAGEYPLVPEYIEKIGYITASIIAASNNSRVKEFVIGRDTRESSEEISKIISKGINSAGINIFDCGVVPTPAISYITSKRTSLAGCVISASHNSSEFNGIKFFSTSGVKIVDKLEAEIEEVFFNEKNKSFVSAKKTGKVVHRDSSAEDTYIKFLSYTLSRCLNLNGLKIVLDCANGSNYKIASRIFSDLKADVTLISAEPDGKNINKDCGALHLENLQKAVIDKKADFGIAYDGDGDRCIFVDNKGEIRDGDYLIAIAANYLKDNGKLKNNAVVTTIMANVGFFKLMESKGIKVLSCSVGDKYVYEEMLKNDIILGGEQSGHIIFRNYLNTGDGLLTSLQIASILKQTGNTLFDLSKIIRKYPQVLLNIRVEKKFPISDNKKLSDAIKDVEDKLKNDGRVVVRYSGTEPLLRIMVEGPDDKTINQYAQEIAEAANTRE
ncbi:MAG: phosphoglucosamine mutase [Elusimicrobia bacterium]|nr:phosphoglucosamine mutase [Elusimicrobiota bacterium]